MYTVVFPAGILHFLQYTFTEEKEHLFSNTILLPWIVELSYE